MPSDHEGLLPVAMPSLRMPADFTRALVWIADLPDGDYAELTQVLQGGTEEVSRSAVASAIEDRVPLGGPSGGELLELLLSLAGLREGARQDEASEIAAAVAASPDLPPEALQTRLQDRLTELLQARAVDLLGRGLDLLAEHEHLLIEARILSDIRPLFDRESPTVIDGAVVGHILRLAFARGEPRSIDIALDLEDLEMLQVTISRAVEKERTLRALIGGSGSPIVIPFGGARVE